MSQFVRAPLRQLVLLASLFAAPAMAAEAIVTHAGGELDVRLVALQYPTNLASELTTGLTNRILARLSVRDGATILQRRTAAVAIRYDLWDQSFRVSLEIEGKTSTRQLPDLDALKEFLGALELPKAFPTASLPNERDLIVSAELLLNPIDREKLGMIRKWVAENSTPQAGGESATAGNSELFGRIFEQYADGSQFATTWRVTVSSRPFRLNAPTHERP
jgi:hypothetical protein